MTEIYEPNFDSQIPVLYVDPTISQRYQRFDVDGAGIGKYLAQHGLTSAEVTSTEIQFLPRLPKGGVGSCQDGTIKVRSEPLLPGAARKTAEYTGQSIDTRMSRDVSVALCNQLKRRVAELGYNTVLPSEERGAKLRHRAGTVALSTIAVVSVEAFAQARLMEDVTLLQSGLVLGGTILSGLVVAGTTLRQSAIADMKAGRFQPFVEIKS